MFKILPRLITLFSVSLSKEDNFSVVSQKHCCMSVTRRDMLDDGIIKRGVTNRRKYETSVVN